MELTWVYFRSVRIIVNELQQKNITCNNNPFEEDGSHCATLKYDVTLGSPSVYYITDPLSLSISENVMDLSAYDDKR